MKHVTIYTDGACSGNPGPGGFGTIITFGKNEKVLAQGFRDTTNNRMEMLAVIVGLEQLKQPCEVTVVTDSQYVANAISQGWVLKWKANGWKRNKKDRAQNVDMWERYLKAANSHEITMQWVRGHNGHAYNERCDLLAVTAASQPDLPLDKR
ncbi:MAG: ribonuclease HI [Chitinivibrionales bacterium]|nr:ribonuclease HI [Chitinivibrionales bacterium]